MTAGVYSADDSSTQKQGFCADIEALAKDVMMMRQDGISMSAQIQIADGMSDADQLKAMYREIVMHAYDAPQYKSKANQEKLANEFANQYALACYRSLEK